MGAGVSNWRLAQSVSRVGQLGVVSGTGLDQILARRLQDGDPEGHMRRALAQLPFRDMAKRILDRFFIPGGKDPDKPYQAVGMHTVEGQRWPQELCIAANFVEVYLAREGHQNPVGINYLEKIQLPHLPSIYGAMLAGVAVVIMGAGIPLSIPGVLDALANHEVATYPVHVSGPEKGEIYHATFNPRDFHEEKQAIAPLGRPDFLPIVSSDTLATMMYRRTNGVIAGFVVEGYVAGGHNAPPRGRLNLTDDGQPIYGPRDVPDLAVMRELGLPFWLAGQYGSRDRLLHALAQGAAGVQVGTAFALCEESALVSDAKQALINMALKGEGTVFTDPTASPTGFPFKVARLVNSLSEADVYAARPRICDMGFLREPYRRADGSIGYRCSAEPEAVYVAKGGRLADTVGRKCLCNALTANVGMPQRLADGSVEKVLVTLGDDLACVRLYCTLENPHYTAADVIHQMLADSPAV